MMLFNYSEKKIYKNVLIIFLYIIFYESYYYGKKTSNWNLRLIPFNTNSKRKHFFNFIKNNSNEIKNRKFFESKRIEISKRKKNLFATNVTNFYDNTIPEEYIKNNIPSEPIYPYISVPDNLYTKKKNTQEKNEEKYPDIGKMTFEEFKKWNDDKLKKVKELPDPTLDDYIEDTKYEKYIHPSLIKNVDNTNHRYAIPYSLKKYTKKNIQRAALNCFDENDVDDDLTEYDCAFKGIGPWPSTDELKKNDNFFEFDKTDLEMEYNITYNKSNYREYKEKNINKKMNDIEEENLNKDKKNLLDGENDSNTNFEKEFINTTEERESELSDNIKENIIDKEKYVNKNIFNKSSVYAIRKLYYKKEVKTIKEAKEEIIKWDIRKNHSRSQWNLSNEEINLLPKHYKELYFEKHKEYEKQKEDLFKKGHAYPVSNKVLLNASQLNDMKNDDDSKINLEDSIEKENYTKTNFENYSENMFQNFRLLEDNVLYTKAKSPIDNILYEWDDPLNCKWRKRAEEVIRDVIMYDYPFKELRRPSNLDLYDVTWYPGKLDVFVTTEEEKNYKITLFDLKQLVKKIAERLKELEIDEEIVILPFFELVVSSLPSKNILVCRKDWNNNIGKEVTVFFKDNIFQPIEGILLGSPSVFHVIINIYDEKIENIIINNIDKIILKDAKDYIGKNIMLRAEIDTKEKRGNEKNNATDLDKNIKKELRDIEEKDEDNELVKEDTKEIERMQFNELDKLKNINKSYKDINDSKIKNINNIDDENSDLVNSFTDNEENENEDEEDDEDIDSQIDSYDNEFDDYMPDE
ncbi:conserved Plasmodium protein, unknown function [Plasmodium relictum]|uniref:Uncharacterized protein n=1 Tax=Plasmodium relictum TaxID=85471 RepID=A0A1J1H9T2_PLARL|nr:conserved Plasmodium protein, unknown function [Plasmodium relictum]CRH01701.1 conserved Plasmodium protein, unknown function [Plasmodium relictum]